LLIKTSMLHSLLPDFTLFQEILTFSVGDIDRNRGPLPDDGLQRYFISLESPRLSLATVVRGMLNNVGCRNDKMVRTRYSGKVFSVLRLIAMALQRLHNQGVVHGHLSLESCAKFDDKWKLANFLGAYCVGEVIHYNEETLAVPPEALQLCRTQGSATHATFRNDFVAQASVDIWAFGKVAYEALVGQPLIPTDQDEKFDSESLTLLLEWNDANLFDVRLELERVGVTKAGIDLIAQCLSHDEDSRLTVDELLQHSFWANTTPFS
jgi:serine/threonine protein kinase